jgi:uncharacterized protein (DUF983 family)
MGAPSGLAALLQLKCPRCRKGDLFLYSAYNIKQFDKMPEHCPVCKLAYEPEVGFYWGAMYISYGFSVMLVVIAGVSLYYLAGDPPTWVYMVAVTLSVLLLTPVMFRYARALMLYWFGGTRFDSRYAD